MQERAQTYLSNSQRDLIDVSIEHLIEFSSNPDELIKEVKLLKKALFTSVKESQQFYQLRQCIYHPTIQLRRLEDNSSNSTTLGVVRSHIVRLITSKLTEAALAAQIKFSRLYWNEADILDKIAANKDIQDDQTLFQTIQLHKEEQELRLLPELTGRIYQQELRQTFNRRTSESEAYVDVTMQYSSVTIRRSVRLDFYAYNADVLRDLPEVDIVENNTSPDMIQEIKMKRYAEKKALHLAASYALSYLTKQFQPYWFVIVAARCGISRSFQQSVDAQITSNQRRDILNSQAAKKIMTTRYYFELIKRRVMSIDTLLQLIDNQADALTNPIVQSLVEQNIVSIDEAKALTIKQIKIIENHNYFPLLRSNAISIRDILTFKDSQCDMLIYPPIALLVTRQVLTMDQASRIPMHLKPLFEKEIYLTMFHLKRIMWQELVGLTVNDCELLLNKNIARLVEIRLLKINDLDLITPQLVRYLDLYPQLMQLLLQRYVSLDDLNDEVTFKAISYTERIFKVFLNNMRTGNTSKESFTDIFNELYVTAKARNFYLIDFQNKILRFLAIHIRLYCKERKNYSEEVDTYSMVYSMLTIVKNTKADVPWINVFHSLSNQTQAANQKLKERQSLIVNSNSFFNLKSVVPESQLCTELMNLSAACVV